MDSQVGVRAAEHALDAALAEHRRGLALAASRRERERMARGREVKAAAAANEAALEQPQERPMRALRVAETWIEVDRGRHALTPAVRATVSDGELRVFGDGWSARLGVAPGEAAAAAAHEAAARIEAAAAAAPVRARRRLERAVAGGAAHAAACHAAAAALAAADRELAERHAEHDRVAAAASELSARLGPRRLGEPPEVSAARRRVEQAHGHLAAVPEQPYAWIGELPPPVAGALLRDLPDDRLDAALPAARHLAAALSASEAPLALAVGAAGFAGAAIAAVTGERVLVADEAGATAHDPSTTAVAGGALQAGGRELVAGLAESPPGRLATVLDLVRDAALLRR
jgi:hypothetical protein